MARDLTHEEVNRLIAKLEEERVGAAVEKFTAMLKGSTVLDIKIALHLIKVGKGE